jgi:hypothetical protein
MARWTDLATWVGTTNRNGGAMANPPRGLVLHIASGFYDGTISWQARSSGKDRTSSHFIVARDGRCAQMVDTADGSWAQKSGNNTWLSIELEGFAPDDGSLHATHPGWETATPQQLEVCARLLARAHRDCGVPLQLATSPSGRGLGHHSMGAESGVDWGHSACPGTAIKNQKPPSSPARSRWPTERETTTWRSATRCRTPARRRTTTRTARSSRSSTTRPWSARS